MDYVEDKLLAYVKQYDAILPSTRSEMRITTKLLAKFSQNIEVEFALNPSMTAKKQSKNVLTTY